MKNKIVSNRMMKYLYCLTFRKLENRVLNSVEKKILKKICFSSKFATLHQKIMIYSAFGWQYIFKMTQ